MKRRLSDDWEDYFADYSDFKKGEVVGCGLIVPPKSGSGKKAHAFLTRSGVACKFCLYFYFNFAFEKFKTNMFH